MTRSPPPSTRGSTSGRAIYVEDLGSTNGTYLNGMRLERRRAPARRSTAGRQHGAGGGMSCRTASPVGAADGRASRWGAAAIRAASARRTRTACSRRRASRGGRRHGRPRRRRGGQRWRFETVRPDSTPGGHHGLGDGRGPSGQRGRPPALARGSAQGHGHHAHADGGASGPDGDRLVLPTSATAAPTSWPTVRRRQLTRTTATSRMLAAGQITAEEARRHPHRHVVARVLGVEPSSAGRHVAATPSWDRYLLCSDGLINEVADDEILASSSGRRPAGLRPRRW